MKTITKLALTVLATAVFATGGAFANDSQWATFQSGNATVTYRRPAQKEATVALKAHDEAIGRAKRAVKTGELRFNYIQTAQGPVSYFSPAR